ncbi:hypothetical protein NHX12_032111, partial [Muraenolepis orangiensis]
MRARWTSDPCYAFYGVDGSECSFLVYLSEVEWFCPPVAWRNQTTVPTYKPTPKKQITKTGYALRMPDLEATADMARLKVRVAYDR